MASVGSARQLTLIANPGSASRKYALYEGEAERAQLHFEWLYGKIICTLHAGGEQHVVHADIHDLGQAVTQIVQLLQANKVLGKHDAITRIGLRIVAPSSYFLEDHVVDDDCLGRLEALQPRAPIHIAATLDELR
ncbi:MAG TPA: hypothetical protein VKQ34_00460, partial [Candidatus Saccharimonadales bacterium]|nr:hypothetical protein [Candidatus Saccharimonadales bacterium]